MDRLTRALRTWWERPKVGAAAVFSSLQTKRAGSRWTERVFGNVSWLLILSVVLVTWLSLRNETSLQITRICVLLGLYTLYVLGLEVASRTLGKYYDTMPFRIGRIVVNVVAVSTLVWLSSCVGSYFWFFYSLPVLQAILYFSDIGVLAVGAGVVIAYWVVSVIATNLLGQSPDYALVVMNSLVLSIVSFVLYWLFRSARESRKVEHFEALLAVQKIPLVLDTATGLDDILERIIKAVTQAVEASSGSLILIDKQTNTLKIRARHPLIRPWWKEDREFKLGEGIAGWVAQHKEPYLCSDAAKDPRFIRADPDGSIRSLLAVPIVSHGRSLGVISVDSTKTEVFDENDTQLLLAFASYVGDRIEKAKLLDALYALGQSASLDLPEALQTILEQLEMIVGYDSAAIFLVEEGRAKIVAAHGFPDEQKAREVSFALPDDALFQELSRTKRPLVLPDVRKDKRFLALVGTEYVRGWLGAPLVTGGRIIGFLTLDSRNVGHFNRVDAELVALFARHATLTIENAQLHRRQTADMTYLARLYQISTALRTSLELQNVLEMITASLQEMFDLTTCTIGLLDDAEERLDFIAHRGLKGPTTRRVEELPQDLWRRVREEGLRVVLQDVARHPELAAQLERRDLESFAVLPLRGKRRFLGILTMSSTGRLDLNVTDWALVTAFADQVAVAIENAMLFEQAHRRAVALAGLHETSLDLTRYQRVPELVNSILERAVELLQVKGGGLYLLDESAEWVKLAAVSNLPEELVGMTLGVGGSVVGQVIKTKAPLDVPDYRNWPHRLRQYDEYGFTAVAGAPIAWQDKIWGVIAVHDDVEGRTFGQEDLDLLSHLGNLAAIALENAKRMDDLERLMASAIDATIVVDEEGRVVRFNEQAEKVSGYSTKEVLGKPVGPLYYDSEEARRVKRLLVKSEEGRVTDLDTFVRSKDGERIPIRLSASLLFDYERRRAGSVGFFRDLREIESAKRQIRQLSGLLAAGQAITSQLDLPSVLNSIATSAMEALGDVDAIALYSYDADKGEFRVPPVVKGVTQSEFTLGAFNPDSVVARVMEIGEAHFADDAVTDPVMAGDFVTRESIASSAGVPLEVGDKIVGVVFFNYRESHPFSDEEKKVISILANQAAIAIEKAQLYEETLRRLEELERTKEMLAARTAVAWMGMVSSTWAHSIGKYAASIRDYVEVLRRKDTVYQELNEIEAMAARIQEIGDTRASSWEEVQIVETNALLRELVPRLVNDDGDKVEMRWQLDWTQDMTVKASRRWLIWAIERVVENALEALADSDTLVLTIGSKLSNGRVKTRISDTGTGIPEAIRSKLFKEPIPAKKKGARDSGVALLLVSTILQSYGGDITVEATGPGGTTMLITLPVASQ